jgi:hypothetical protein
MNGYEKAQLVFLSLAFIAVVWVFVLARKSEKKL